MAASCNVELGDVLSSARPGAFWRVVQRGSPGQQHAKSSKGYHYAAARAPYHPRSRGREGLCDESPSHASLLSPYCRTGGDTQDMTNQLMPSSNAAAE